MKTLLKVSVQLRDISVSAFVHTECPQRFEDMLMAVMFLKGGISHNISTEITFEGNKSALPIMSSSRFLIILNSL